MPKAVPEANNLAEVVNDSTVLQRVAAGELDITVTEDSPVPVFAFDRRLVSQAITNLVKNAREAVEGRESEGDKTPGQIKVVYGMRDENPYVSVIDNGIGLPHENRHRLAEPYMTTRDKGTGLGLAIVKRIMQEHGGSLQLTDAPGHRGAQVTLRFAAINTDVKLTA